MEGESVFDFISEKFPDYHHDYRMYLYHCLIKANITDLSKLDEALKSRKYFDDSEINNTLNLLRTKWFPRLSIKSPIINTNISRFENWKSM